MEHSSPDKIKQPETERFGTSVTIRNYWQRHAQKMSGEVFNAGQTGISTSAISPSGAEKAETLGETFEAGQHGAKGYVSDSKRTEETLDAMLTGYQKSNPNAPVREKFRVKNELVAWGPPEFLKLYNEKWSANKTKLLAERGLQKEDFFKLTPDEQQEIAETAEEPVIREWLDNPESELAKSHPPSVAAAKFAALFNRRHERMAGKLYSGSEIDIFHGTHKTVTEPFLTSGVLIRKSDGKRITKLEELGGSLGILDNWESEVVTDQKGIPATNVKIRGKEYKLDHAALDALVAEKN